MNEYQEEQLQALEMVRNHLAGFSDNGQNNLRALVSDYLSFRREMACFLEKHFSHVCTRTCYQSNLSACCTREGIITFFADVVVNVLSSSADEIEKLHVGLKKPHEGTKCLYLGQDGCRWRVKPLVCEMFLCARAEKEVLSADPRLEKEWERLNKRAKSFRWPDRPVLFDKLEEIFIDGGCTSGLMYLHNSPGLLRVKEEELDPKRD